MTCLLTKGMETVLDMDPWVEVEELGWMEGLDGAGWGRAMPNESDMGPTTAGRGEEEGTGLDDQRDKAGIRKTASSKLLNAPNKYLDNPLFSTPMLSSRILVRRSTPWARRFVADSASDHNALAKIMHEEAEKAEAKGSHPPRPTHAD